MDTNPTPKLDLSWITGDLLLYLGGAIALVAAVVVLVAWLCVRANEARAELERDAEETARRDEALGWDYQRALRLARTERGLTP